MNLNAAGDFGWAHTFGSTGGDVGWGVAVDGAGTAYLAGIYTGTVDFDPDPLAIYELTTPGVKGNAFLLKLNQN